MTDTDDLIRKGREHGERWAFVAGVSARDELEIVRGFHPEVRHSEMQIDVETYPCLAAALNEMGFAPVQGTYFLNRANPLARGFMDAARQQTGIEPWTRFEGGTADEIEQSRRHSQRIEQEWIDRNFEALTADLDPDEPGEFW